MTFYDLEKIILRHLSAAAQEIGLQIVWDARYGMTGAVMDWLNDDVRQPDETPADDWLESESYIAGEPIRQEDKWTTT